LTILVVDDDAGIRRLVRRVLTQEFGVDIVEAEDGVGALEYLLQHRADLVVLDMWMPIISGLETLETIRRSANHADVPVVMMSGRADEVGVQRAVRLGAREILAKPFSPGTLRERFAKLINDESAETPQGANLLEIQDTDTALIVDTSEDFRALARTELRRICRVEESPNEFAALSRCLAGGVDLIVVGTTSEMSSTEVLGRKIRGLKQLRGLRMVAAVAENESRLTGLYDAAIVRSFVPETLLASLIRILEPPTLGRLLFHPGSRAIADFCAEAVGVFAELVEGPAMHTMAPGLAGEDVQIGAAVEVQALRGAWDVRVTCTNSTALEIAGRLFEKNLDELAETDPALAVIQLAGLVGERLKAVMTTSGLPLKALPARPSPVTEWEGSVHNRTASICRRWISVAQREAGTLEVVRLKPTDPATSGIRAQAAIRG
jgi:CheY-like chemotaxis protein